MNKIVFTQDVPGEREWLESLFPLHENLRSEFGNTWPTAVPTDLHYPLIWEIPPESTVDVSKIAFDKIKSLYTIDDEFIANSWCESSTLLSNKLTFSHSPRSKFAHILTFTRTGTVFLEEVLYNKCGYIKKRNHSLVPDKNSDSSKTLYKFIEDRRPDIFIPYRTDWWEWLVSVMISRKYDWYHHYSKVEWDKLEPFDLARDDIDLLVSMVKHHWQGLCHLRTKFPNLNFYVVEFSDIIANDRLTNHRAVSYNKKLLVKNYDSMKTLFEVEYLSNFRRWERNILGHFKTMNFIFIKNFDQFLV
jgi:hypothetical protein